MASMVRYTRRGLVWCGSAWHRMAWSGKARLCMAGLERRDAMGTTVTDTTKKRGTRTGAPLSMPVR